MYNRHELNRSYVGRRWTVPDPIKPIKRPKCLSVLTATRRKYWLLTLTRMPPLPISDKVFDEKPQIRPLRNKSPKTSNSLISGANKRLWILLPEKLFNPLLFHCRKLFACYLQTVLIRKGPLFVGCETSHKAAPLCKHSAARLVSHLTVAPTVVNQTGVISN